MRQAGKGVILEMASDTLKARIEKIIRSEQISRTSVKLSSAVLFTQVIIYIHVYIHVYKCIFYIGDCICIYVYVHIY
jgi:hypothetical protein